MFSLKSTAIYKEKRHATIEAFFILFIVDVLEKGKYSGSIAKLSGSEGIIACMTAYSKDHFNGALHYHYNAHLSFALEGGCVEKKKDIYELLPGSITYYSAGEPHQVVKVVRPTRRINVELEQSFVDFCNISDKTLRAAITKNPDARFILVRIYKELLAGDDISPAAIHSLVFQLIHRAEQRYNTRELPVWARLIEDYLYSNRDEPVALRELSAVSNVHPVTISRYFPIYFGCTLGEYIRKLRIEKALSLIKLKDYSLTEIAYECGFFDQSHFIRAFKQLTGFLPSSYQKS